MNKVTTAIVAALIFLTASPALAARNIVADWATGEVTITEDQVDEMAEDEAARRHLEEALAAEEQIEKLKRVIEIQQKVVKRQRALIKDLRRENQRLENIILGYDQLLRRCQ